MKIRISDIVNDSIVDGAGIRLTVFTQGCSHECVGCHNPQTHDPEGGRDSDIDFLLRTMKENPLLDGITLSGGEPFEQPLPCLTLAKGAHEMNMNVWAYTGYTWEDILAGEDEDRISLLKECDVLVDGRFEIDQRSLNLLFRGSQNQRLIDVHASLDAGQVILWEAKSYEI